MDWEMPISCVQSKLHVSSAFCSETFSVRTRDAVGRRAAGAGTAAPGQRRPCLKEREGQSGLSLARLGSQSTSPLQAQALAGDERAGPEARSEGETSYRRTLQSRKRRGQSEGCRGQRRQPCNRARCLNSSEMRRGCKDSLSWEL